MNPIKNELFECPKCYFVYPMEKGNVCPRCEGIATLQPFYRCPECNKLARGYEEIEGCLEIHHNSHKCQSCLKRNSCGYLQDLQDYHNAFLKNGVVFIFKVLECDPKPKTEPLNVVGG